jgi:hypothetical protein
MELYMPETETFLPKGADRRLYTMAGIVQFYGADYHRLKGAAVALKLEPVFSINMVDHYSHEQVMQILDRLGVEDRESGRHCGGLVTFDPPETPG